jgi:hypothetical protein
VNGDGVVTLADAILALRILAGDVPAGTTIAAKAAVTDNQRIGLPEVLFILQRSAGSR